MPYQVNLINPSPDVKTDIVSPVELSVKGEPLDCTNEPETTDKVTPEYLNITTPLPPAPPVPATPVLPAEPPPPPPVPSAPGEPSG